MGLDTSHNAWHGAYSAFMRWRQEIAKVAGFPPLELMESYFGPGSISYDHLMAAHQRDQYGPASFIVRMVERGELPIKWDRYEDDPLCALLHHSDCDGEIAPEDCAKIAKRLRKLLPLLPSGDAGGHIGNWRDKTKQFIEGCEAAAAAGEPLDFH